MGLKSGAATGLQRYWIPAGEYVTVRPGFVMVVDAFGVIVVDGLLRLDGALKVL